MKNTYKLALVAALGLVTGTAAQAATTDLLLGFNDAAASSTTAQNDYVIDLGYTSASLLSATATAGGTLDLGTLINSTTFTTAFGSDANAANNVAAGVVGSTYPGTSYTLDVTGTSTPKTLSGTPFAQVAAATQASPTGEYASSGQSAASPGWTYEVATSPTSQSGNSTGVSALGSNPTANLSSGILTISLYQAAKGGTLAKPTYSAFSWIGQFTINTITDDVSFTTVSIPEPGTYGVLAAGGLLLVSLRRQIMGKVA